MIRVVTICHGTKYPWEYVQALADGVREHLAEPHEFLCYTEDPRPLSGGTPIELPSEIPLAGWWWKLWLFAPEHRATPILWLDLDTVLCGSIDWLVGGDRFLILRDFYRPDGWQSSVMYLPTTVGDDVWTRYRERGLRQTDPRGDQVVIEKHFDRTHPWATIQEAFPGQVRSWKADNVETCGRGDASLIVFHGPPRPHEVGMIPGVGP